MSIYIYIFIFNHVFRINLFVCVFVCLFVCLYSSLHMSISNVEDVWKPYYIWVDFVSNGFPSLMNISWCYFPIQHTVERGWQILIPHEDKSMLLFIYSSIQGIVQRGWQNLIPYEDKLMLLPHWTYCSEGGCRFWFIMKISWCHCLFILLFNTLFRGSGRVWFLMKISWYYYPI